ncbi:hypothetical protein BJ165DRAFT_1520966 [Panaeolus papilionaceus]|nr:hypothetical protein BJ165DRAFT_1520966 [Panaeolus papilionaceus]
MPPEPTRKPHPKPTKPYSRKPKDPSKQSSSTNQPRTSAKPPAGVANIKENLTLGDWLVVFRWIDAETKRRGGGKPLTIDEIVEPISEYIDPELDAQDVAPGMNDEDLLKIIVDRVEGKVEVIEVEEEESDEDEEDHITRTEAIDLVAKVEKVLVNFGGDLKVASSLRAFRRDLVTEMTKNASQSHIDTFFKPSTTRK